MSAVIADPSKFDAPVKGLMKPPFARISIDESINHAITELSKKQHAVLVEDGGAIVGILTRFDVIEYMSR